jgi:hypothetical protein
MARAMLLFAKTLSELTVARAFLLKDFDARVGSR